MTRTITVGLVVLLFSLISAYILIICSVYSVFKANHDVISTDILGGDYLTESENWSTYRFFLKFNTPGGKHYYISNYDGVIDRAKDEIVVAYDLTETEYSDEEYYELEDSNITEASTLPNMDEEYYYEPDEDESKESNSTTKRFPYISFVSLNQRLYDIYFEFNGIPYIKENTNISADAIPTYILIRHRLHSFVGQNNNIYRIIYNHDNVSHISISESSPAQHLDHYQIKTFGPYCKWEHTYNFSPDGLKVTDHFISPVEVAPNRSINLPQIYPDSEMMDQTFVVLNTPSRRKYCVTTKLDILFFHDDDVVRNITAPLHFISYIAPTGRIYDIYFHIDERGYHSSLENVGILDDYYGPSRLLSFIGPDKKLYRINHDNVTDIPLLVAASDNKIYNDLELTVSRPDRDYNYYNQLVKYTFRDDGKDLYDREDDFDWTPLNEQPGLDLEEVDADSEIALHSLLSFYSPSGKNYHITTTNTSDANIVVEKGEQNTRSFYIKFTQDDGRIFLIYVSPHQDPYIMDDGFSGVPSPNNSNNITIKGEDYFVNAPPPSPFSLTSFVTPFKKLYFVDTKVDDIGYRLVVRTAQRQPTDPLDETPEKSLTITFENMHNKHIFEFSWSGHKFLNLYTQPLIQMLTTMVSQSLIGGGRLDEKYLKQQRREWYAKKNSAKN